MHRTSRHIPGKVAFAALLAISLGSRPQCDLRTAGAPCDMPSIVVEPGACVTLDDPCGTDWGDLVSLSLDTPVDGIWFEVTRRPTGNTVRICADDDADLTMGYESTVRIVDTDGRLHKVVTEVATIAPLDGYVTALPETVTALDTLQLTAHVSGGVPPYTYLWRQFCYDGDFIGDATSETVTAFSACGEFWITLRDALDTPWVLRVLVPTYAIVTATADPDTIDPGGTSKLRAAVVGSTYLGSYWDPSTGLSDPRSWMPSASPAKTTQYTFYVTSDTGLKSSASVVVYVRP